MKYCLCASGSKGNCFILQDEGTTLMIDCGSTKGHITHCLKDMGIEVGRISGVLITHDHSDHISQIRMVADRTIFSPVRLKDVKVNEVKPFMNFMIDHLKITPLPLSHDAPDTTGYIIENDHEKLVYVTDTGYVNKSLIPYLMDANYIVMECNHDVGMLMKTSRPYYLKQRICSDSGHLCNEACGEVLQKIVGPQVRQIILAHISQQANTMELALNTVLPYLKDTTLKDDVQVVAAGQYEMIYGGEDNEETDCRYDRSAVMLEYRTHGHGHPQR